MQTFDDLRNELLGLVSQTQHDIEDMTALQHYEGPHLSEPGGFRDNLAAFQHRHTAALAALAQLDALEASVIADLLHEWETHANPAIQEIAHDYQTGGTLAY
jgi:hypothetical protein